MRLSQHSHRSLILLYGASALALAPFGILYATAVRHGWDRNGVLLPLLIVGLACAITTWSAIEHRLPPRQVIPRSADLSLESSIDSLASIKMADDLNRVGKKLKAIESRLKNLEGSRLKDIEKRLNEIMTLL